ncbi:MAG: OmpH family outer membrane protein [Spirochaetes bacterium]|jgi:Skp family chaperone for outer membrane proteins|nr:OmpH family outer membrane protein [Spirochaetota bacterium]
MAKKIFLFIVPILIISSCSIFKQKSNAPEGQLNLRYMNLKTVYNFMLGRDREAEEIKKMREETDKKIAMLEQAMFDPRADRAKAVRDLEDGRKNLSEIKAKSNYHKNKILNTINRAVKNVAEKIEADFILNIGDGVIYSKKEYDVTEDVIKELMRLENRRAEVSR